VLTMTPQALSVVRQVTGHPRLGEDSGLRIGDVESGSDSLRVRAVASPQPGDDVVEGDGGRLFLGRQARRRLRGRVLDAVVGRGGRVQFVLRRQA
jgi:iron-sulfur cluster assembly protein